MVNILRHLILKGNEQLYLLHSLYGSHEPIDGVWERLEPEKYTKSLIPIESLSVSQIEEDGTGQFKLDEVDHYLIDPWSEPYIYEFPRNDGNLGFCFIRKDPIESLIRLMMFQTDFQKRERKIKTIYPKVNPVIGERNEKQKKWIYL